MVLLADQLTLSPVNLTNEKEIAPTPFSLQEIQSYVDFFNFSRDICTPCDDKRIVKAIIITVIIANFCEHGVLPESYRTNRSYTRQPSDEQKCCHLVPGNDIPLEKSYTYGGLLRNAPELSTTF